MKYRLGINKRTVPHGLCMLALLLNGCSNGDEDSTRSSTAALCNDGNSCTFDSYSFVGGVFGCQHIPVGAGITCSALTLCGASGTCDASGKGPPNPKLVQQPDVVMGGMECECV